MENNTMRKNITLVLIAAVLVGLWTSFCWADDSSPKKEKKKRPLAVLHASLDKQYDDGIDNVRYRCTIWLRNVSHNDVENVKCKLVVRDGAKKYYEKEKEIETIPASKRVFVNYKWEDLKDYKITPEIWITYKNDEGKEEEFQAYAPTWE